MKSVKIYYVKSLLDIENTKGITFYCSNNECISAIKDNKGDFIKLNVEGNVGTGEVTIYDNEKIGLSFFHQMIDVKQLSIAVVFLNEKRYNKFGD